MTTNPQPIVRRSPIRAVLAFIREPDRSPRDEVDGRKVLLFVAILALTIIVGVIADPGHWRPFGAWLTLVLFAVIGDISGRYFGALSVTNTTIPLGVSVALFGIIPSVALALITVLVVDRVRGPWHVAVNSAGYAMFCAGNGLILRLAHDSGMISMEPESLGLWALIGTVVGETANFGTVVLSTVINGRSLRTTLRASVVPMLPYEIGGIAGVGLTVYGFQRAGYAALPASAALVGTLAWTLHLLSRGERRAAALDEALVERDQLSQQLVSAEERARRALAADLHDDALQLLAVARHDLEDGELDVLEGRLAAVDESLRDLLVRLDAFGTRTTVVTALDELVATIGARSGLTIACAVDPKLSDAVDAGLVSCARELLLNVEKHADASNAWISADPTTLTVADDGRGGSIDIPAALERGHVGLALVASRARERGGELAFAARAGGGLKATVTFRPGAGSPAPTGGHRAAAGGAAARTP